MVVRDGNRKSYITHQVSEVVRCLCLGQVAGIPTETVYGLAGSIEHDQALGLIFDLKKRPRTQSLIVHAADVDMLMPYVCEVEHDLIARLAQAYWPGPLTLILPSSSRLSGMVSGGRTSVAVRVPSHPLALAVIRAVGHPLAAPSANVFGHISPTCAQHVLEEFPDAGIPVLDGGACAHGLESTMVDLSQPGRAVILRPGPIHQDALAQYFADASRVVTRGQKVGVSGNLESHYAPRKSCVYYDDVSNLPAALQAELSSSIGLTYTAAESRFFGISRQLSQDPSLYGREFYAALRWCEQQEGSTIFVQMPPRSVEWEAVCNRIRKAGQSA